MSVPDGKPPRAIVFGCQGLSLTDDEQRFFRASDPFGFILFARNCDTPEQVRALVGELRDSVQRRDAPVLIDQEGGRVARLSAPHWRHPPPQGKIAALAEISMEDAERAAFLNARLIGRELAALGITVNCLPVLDIPAADGHEIIGDRALGRNVDTVARLGRSVCKGLLTEGILPVIKHIPGHGRARVDSHRELPVVDVSIEELQETDFEPFRLLSDQPWGMTAHVVYSALDPAAAATVSGIVVEKFIRTEIGFSGVLLSDDIGMEALEGDLADRAADAIAAGCDLALHCSGVMEEMKTAASRVPPMTSDAEGRTQLAEALRLAEGASGKPDFSDMLNEFDSLMMKGS